MTLSEKYINKLRKLMHNRIFSKISILVLTLCSFSAIHAQISITASNAALDPQALIETFFLGEGVEVTNINYTGDNNAVGFFTDGLNEIGIDRGIVMGSGNVVNAAGAYDDFASSDTNGPNSDPDLDNISTVGLMDVSKYEITFIPTADTLRFKYVFSSEEYPQYNCSQFNDVFGFFITGPDPAGGSYNGKNIALVPDPSDPTGTTFTNLPVSIANVHGAVPANNCAGSFEEYYNDNVGGAFLAYGAYLDVFIAQAVVVPCEEYTIKLAIADGFDAIFDSGVFLEAKSFGTGSLVVDIQTVSLDGSIAEGCNPGKIVISLANPVEEDYIVDAQLIDCGNSATFDVDYFGIPNPIVIPKGESRVEFEIFAIDEGVIEGDEFICFDIQRDICNRDTVSIKISESPLTNSIIEIPNDTTICQNEIVYLSSNLPPSFVLPPAPMFESTFDQVITNELVPNNFSINVSGVVPDYLTNGVIKSVCIDTLEHRFLTDVDLYLVTPNGQFLELSTDNGNKPLNGTDIDFMINTCFTPFANIEIENGSSLSGPIFPNNTTYTGDFLPEGVWQDIYGPDTESNGVYDLVYIDDETGAFGRLTGWSICFNPIYNLTYQWSSDVHGNICTNCVDFPIEVGQNTMFYLEVTDSYGCGFIDSFNVTTNTLLPAVTNLSCDSVAQDFIRFIWDGEPTADSYEIFIPGIIDPAINIGQLTEWAVSGLVPLADYEIQVKTIGGICDGEISTIICSTIKCNVDDLVITTLNEVSCFGSSDGVLDVEITGVFPPFTYEYRGVSNGSGFFDNLVAGPDTLYITDLSGCVSKFEIDIPSPKALNVDYDEIVDISCFNQSDGGATAFPFGGTAPYMFLWESGELNETATQLSPGWNTLTITDNNGCELIDSILFLQPSILDANHLFQDVSCFGYNDGAAIINPTGGTSPYQFTWDDPLNQKTKQVTNLVAGTYTVTITDDNGCQVFEVVEINQPNEIISNVVGSSVSCFNSIDGTATVNIIGGNNPFDFLWDNNEMSNPAINLTPGKHYVTITDANECAKVDSVTILAPAEIEIGFNNSDVTCANGADGVISWLVIGGTGTITVTDDGGNIVTSPINNVQAGVYCFNFMDAAACFVDTCITINDGISINLLLEPTQESCFNSNDASVVLTASNGVEPYMYSWTGPGVFQSNTKNLNNINSGKYFVTVTDANGCEKVDSVTLIEPEEILILADVFNIACKNEPDGIINITVQGGVEPFQFSWLGPNGFTSNEQDLLNVLAGTYTLIFKDANDCTIQKQYEIIEPSQGINSGISNDDEICFGAKNGIANVQPFGGTLPYDITWSNNSKFTNINGLSPGVYYVTIIDGSNCSIVDSVEVIERPEIMLNLDQTSSICYESFDGTASVDQILVNGVAQNLSDFTYLWNSFPLQTTSKAVNLKGGGDYLVVVTDNLGCSAKQSIVIDTPDPVTADLVMVDSIDCALGDDGSIVIKGIGGNGPYQYQWGQDANFQVGPAAKNLKAGVYDVTVTDNNNCTGIDVFEIKDPFPITLNYRIFDVLCYGEETGEVELIANGGTEPYEFNWSTGSRKDNIVDLVIGWYNITVTDRKGCELVDSVFVDQPSEPLNMSASVKTISCAEGQDGSIVILAEGGAGNYIYSLDNFLYNGSIEQIGLSEGTYTAFVKDGNGCIDSIENIDVFAPAPLELELGPDLYLTYGQNFQFDPIVSNFQNPLIYEWVSPDNDLLSCVDCKDPFLEAVKQSSFKLVIIDGKGCLVEDYVNVYITTDNAVFVPTGFTPNGDFNNDLLSVFGKEGIKILSFRVFDKWGEMVYENLNFDVNDDSMGWDGNFRSKEMPPGVYTWYVEADLFGGNVEIFSGNTTLIK